MHSILVVFVILLAILILISALGGSLNLQEKFEEDNQNSWPEMVYQQPEQTEEEVNSVPLAPIESAEPTVVPPTTQTVETFSNVDVEPFEEDDIKFGSPL